MNGIVTTDLLRALDISYGANLAAEDPDRFRAWCEARKAEGYELLIVNCWLGNATPLGAGEALQIAREVGLLIANYCAIHDGRTGREHVLKAMEGAGREWPMLEFVAVDCEEVEGVSLSPRTIRSALDQAAAVGQRPILYTRGTYWRSGQRDTHEFARYPLWEAFYDGDANLHGGAWLGAPFGGFAEPIGKQYLGTTDIEGVAVDFSVFSRGWLESLIVKGERMQNLTGVVDRITEELTELWQLSQIIATEGDVDRAVEMQQVIVEIKRAIGIQSEE